MLKFLVKVFISLYLLHMLVDQVDTMPVARYWSEVLSCTFMTHHSDLKVKDLEILCYSFWLKFLELCYRVLLLVVRLQLSVFGVIPSSACGCLVFFSGFLVFAIPFCFCMLRDFAHYLNVMSLVSVRKRKRGKNRKDRNKWILKKEKKKKIPVCIFESSLGNKPIWLQ